MANITFSSFVDEFLDLASKHNLFSVIGSPVSLPESLARVMAASVVDEDGDITSVEDGLRQFGGGGGCNDAYSAFGFLSFLFALLTFIQNNQGRRKRETRTEVKLRMNTSGIYTSSSFSVLWSSLFS